MPLNVMTWNIEQFGESRSGNPDILNEVGRLIHAATPVPDIIVLLEIKTAKATVACQVAQAISDRVWAESGQTRRYNYIISFCNNLEIYVYMYLAATVTPLTLAVGIHKSYYDDPNKTGADKLIDLNFVPTAGVNSVPSSRKIIETEKTILNSFPLLKYNKLSPCRPPGVGFFRYGAHVLAVVAWHNMSGNDDKSFTHMANMANAWFVANQRFRIRINNTATNVENILITGDFNLDYCGTQGEQVAYNSFTNFTTHITGKTYLEQYLAGEKYPYPQDILSAGFDNHIFHGAALGMTVNQAFVMNIPDWYMNQGKKQIIARLKQSQFINSQYVDDDELAKERLRKYLGDKLKVMNRKGIPQTTQQERNTIIAEAEKQLAKLRERTVYSRLPETKQILGNYFEKFAKNLYAYATGPTEFKGYRYALIKTDSSSMLWGDALFICRRFASDHLPVMIEFN
jgi:hypothetical protein